MSPLQKYEELRQSAKNGDLEAMKEILRKKIDTPRYMLRASSRNGNLKSVQYLLENTDASNLDTSLLEAISNDHIQIVNYLLDNGAKMTYVDEKILSTLASSNKINMMTLTIERLKPLLSQKRNKIDRSTLVPAASNGHLTMLKSLIELGADMTPYISEVISGAINNNHTLIIDYVINNYPVSKQSLDDFLKLAAESTHVDVVKCLVDNGADISSSNNRPINIARGNEDLEMVQCLFDIYQTENPRNIKEFSLRMAVRDGYFPLVKFLIERGVSPYDTINRGYNSLYLAKLYKAEDVLDYLSTLPLINEADKIGLLDLTTSNKPSLNSNHE